jgi:hypothetical protein
MSLYRSCCSLLPPPHIFTKNIHIFLHFIFVSGGPDVPPPPLQSTGYMVSFFNLFDILAMFQCCILAWYLSSKLK